MRRERVINFNDAMSKALFQARAMQKQILDASTAQAEAVKPHLEKSLQDARELQATLTAHATETSAVAAKATESAIAQVTDYIRIGTEAMRESAEQTRAATIKMVDHSKNVVDAAAEAMSTRRE